MNITLLCISDSDKHFSHAISEYTKRLWWKVEIINLKPVKHWSKKQIIKKETEMMKQKIEIRKKKWDQVYLLSKEGEMLSTEKFTKKFSKSKHLWVWISLIIGWPYGLDEKLLQSSLDWSISLGHHTMPHGLAKLVLLEQIYRVFMIEGGRKYHY